VVNLVDRVLYNGNIVTMDTTQPRVASIAISHGRIVAVGNDDDMLAFGGAGTSRENLGGRFVIPGLTDSHIHYLATTEFLHQVNLFEVPSKDEALERVRVVAAKVPTGTWIQGYGWWQELWTDRRFPTAQDLDAFVPDHPVFLRIRSGHAAWVNSFVLRLCGIDRDTPEPEGGQIYRDSEGEPTGILFETPAMELVSKRIPAASVGQIAERMKATQALLLSHGVTGIHDFDDQSCLAALQYLRENGELGIRAVKNINKDFIPTALEMGLRWGFGDDWLRIGGVKLFADGALGSRTASMIEPYEGDPNNYGIVVTDKEEMAEIVTIASKAGLPATVHAIGDKAVHDVLDMYETVRGVESAQGISRSTRRHRVEHVQMIHVSDVDRLAELELIASMQPIHATSDYEVADRYWGRRAALAYNPRIQLDRGVTVTFGSDSPYDHLNPFAGIHAAITRRRRDGTPQVDGWYPEARISVDEALHGYTAAPAYTAGMENRLGKIAPGFLADLVVIDRDLHAIPPDDILDTQVKATMVGGSWRFGGVEA
jgi:predicted amidohydrolase YtcJ